MTKIYAQWVITKEVGEWKGKQVGYKFVVDSKWRFDSAQPMEGETNIRKLER